MNSTLRARIRAIAFKNKAGMCRSFAIFRREKAQKMDRKTVKKDPKAKFSKMNVS
jgi:hypothetical protein